MRAITIEPEDDLEVKRIAKAFDMACCLFDLKNNMWRKWKYSDTSPTGEEVLEEMNRIIDEHNINVDDLVG